MDECIGVTLGKIKRCLLAATVIVFVTVWVRVFDVVVHKHAEYSVGLLGLALVVVVTGLERIQSVAALHSSIDTEPEQVDAHRCRYDGHHHERYYLQVYRGYSALLVFCPNMAITNYRAYSWLSYICPSEIS